jgi:phage protein D
MPNYAAFAITIGGSTLSVAADGMEVSKILVDLEADKIDMATVKLNNAARGVLEDGKLGAKSRIKINIGDTMKIDLGYAKGEVTLFLGEVVCLEPSWPEGAPAGLTVRGMDRAHRLKRGSKIRFWEDKKDSDLVSEIAGDHGLSAECDTTDVTHAYILQNNLSDAEFLKYLARRNHFHLQVDDSKIKFIKPAVGGGTEVELTYSLDLMDCRMRLNAIGQVDEVIVRGWDIFQKKEIVGKAKPSDLSKGAGKNLGADLAKDAFGAAKAYVTTYPVADQGAAQSLAKGLLGAKANQFLTGTGRCSGNPEIKPGSTVKLKELGVFSGKYYVTAARHQIGQRGYITDFDFCSNTDGGFGEGDG